MVRIIFTNVRGNVQQMLDGGHNLRLRVEAESRAPATAGTRKPGQSAHAEITQGSFPDVEKSVLNDQLVL